MSDSTATTTTTNECTSCQLFLRVGIPVVVVFIIIVVASIVWFDRYDKHRLQKKLDEKRANKKLQIQEKKNSSSEDNFFDNTTSIDEETNLSIYTLPSKSIIVKSTEQLSDQISSKDSGSSDLEVGRVITSKSPIVLTKKAIVVPSYRVHRFQALVQQVHDENFQHLSNLPNIHEELVDEVMSDDNDDQSSIESDATPVVTNNNNNNSTITSSSSLNSTVILELPVLPSKDMVSHAEIGLMRNNLSIPGTTESESTSSSSSTSSSLSNCHHISDIDDENSQEAFTSITV